MHVFVYVVVCLLALVSTIVILANFCMLPQANLCCFCSPSCGECGFPCCIISNTGVLVHKHHDNR